LSCTSHRPIGISFTRDASGFPPNEWFRLLAKAGEAVTGADLKKLESASPQCHRSALQDRTELAYIEIPSAKIECQAFTRPKRMIFDKHSSFADLTQRSA